MILRTICLQSAAPVPTPIQESWLRHVSFCAFDELTAASSKTVMWHETLKNLQLFDKRLPVNHLLIINRLLIVAYYNCSDTLVCKLFQINILQYLSFKNDYEVHKLCFISWRYYSIIIFLWQWWKSWQGSVATKVYKIIIVVCWNLRMLNRTVYLFKP